MYTNSSLDIKSVFRRAVCRSPGFFKHNALEQLCITHAPYVGSSVHKAAICLEPPDRTPTPYGGRLTWKLPGGTSLIAHLKDKNKIRHKKRWSQCMYMYYLLGYRLCGGSDDQLWKVWYGMIYLFFRDSTKQSVKK